MTTAASNQQLPGFDTLLERFRNLTPRPRVVVVSPTDEPTRAVIRDCAADGSVDFLLTVDRENRHRAEDLVEEFDNIELHVCDDLDLAAARGVELIREGRANVLMKGAINTDRLLRAVLNKQHGLLPEGRVLSHITLCHPAAYHKPLVFMDAAVIPAPDTRQLEAIMHYGIDTCHRLGVSRPRVALIHFSEKPNQKFPYTMDYLDLIERTAAGQFGPAVANGPMDVKTACDRHSAQIKGMDSEVAGEADLIVFPNLVAGNVFYKTVSLFCDSPMAGMLCGTTVPVVVPSRADHDSSKLYSLALACLMAPEA